VLNKETIMKKLVLIAALALASSGALAQSNQGRTVESPRHPTANAPAPNGMREGTTTTTGMGADQTGGPNGSPAQPPKAKRGPAGSPSKDESPPR
jgi:hypothetical protein